MRSIFNKYVFILTLIGLSGGVYSQGAVSDAVELAALEDLYNSTGGSSWTSNVNWPTDWSTVTSVDDLIGAFGLSISNHDVTHIDLTGNNLTGTIPSSIGNLGALYYLQLTNNSLSGSLPASLAIPTNLQYIFLDGNQLSGTIPDLSGASALKMLYLNSNDFSGSIPASLGDISTLTRLFLHGNQLTGGFPSNLFNLNNLTGLNVAVNPLGGSIPSMVGQLSSLQSLDVSQCNLTGSLPTELGNLTNLITLNVSYNNLTGSIPTSLGNLVNLQYALFNTNSLTGSIPSQIQNWTSLKFFYFFNNSLSGPIPDVFTGYNQLQLFLAFGNKLTGPLPASLGSLSTVTQIKLGNNRLEGEIPSSWQGLAGLTNLQLNNNFLYGPLPEFLTSFNSLTELRVHYNHFTSLPDFNSHVNPGQLTVDINVNHIPSADIQANQGLFSSFTSSNQTEGVGIPEWTNIVGYNLDQTNGLTKTITWGERNSGAASLQVLPAGHDGWVETTVLSNDVLYYFGLSESDLGTDKDDMNYRMRVESDINRIQIREFTTWRMNFTFAIGDVIRIERTGTSIQYKKNGSVMYTSPTASTTDLILDVGIADYNRRIANTFISFPDSYATDDILAPSNLQVTTGSGSQVSWTDNSNNEGGFYIKRSHNPTGGFEVIGQVGANTTTFTDPDVLPGITYHYVVTAFGNTVESPLSEVASATFWIGGAVTDQPEVSIINSIDYSNYTELRAKGEGEFHWFTTYPQIPMHIGEFFRVRTLYEPQTIIVRKYTNGYYGPPLTIEVNTTQTELPFTLTSCSNQLETELNNLLSTVNGLGDLAIRNDNDKIGCVVPSTSERSLSIFSKSLIMNKLCNNVEVNTDCLDPSRTNNHISIVDDRRGSRPYEFRLIWGSYESNYGYYGSCSPAEDGQTDAAGNPLLLLPDEDANYDGGIGSCANNHVFMFYFYYNNENGQQIKIAKEDIASIGTFYIDSYVTNLYGYQFKSQENLATDIDLKNGQQVKAYISHGYGYPYFKWYAEPVVSTISVLPNEVLTPLSFGVEPVSQSEIQVRWRANEASAQYVLERSSDNNSFSSLATLSASTSSYVDAAVTRGEYYYYRLKKLVGSEESAYTQALKAKTFGAPLGDLEQSLQHNGNISGITYSNYSEEDRQVFTYHYDPMNRLTDAQYAQDKVGAASPWDEKIGGFGVDGISYDLNGNINTLNRQAIESDINRIDELSYTYDGNQLLDVADGGSYSGFKDGNQTGDDYDYDANGNLIKDLNKDILSIEYNHLNLPKRVERSDGKYIEYYYDAAGTKLEQKVFEDQLVYTRYMGEFIYKKIDTDVTLELIHHDEGRIVKNPVDNSWEYQYHLKDHLGNVRTTVTSQQHVIEFKVNYEDDPANPDDMDLFEEVQRSSVWDFNTTPGTYTDNSDYTHSQILYSSPHSQVGSILAIPVGKGDSVNASVMAKYISASENTSLEPITIAAALISAFTGSVTGTTEFGSTTINNNYGSGSLIGTSGFPSNSSAPSVFLNMLFLSDKEVETIDQNRFTYDQINQSATESVIGDNQKDPFDELTTFLKAPSNGFIIIYVSNEGSMNDVFFDDFHVTVTESPVIQAEDYYPFGLEFNSYKRVTGKENNFLYNQGTGEKTFKTERISALDLNVDMTKFRVFDPALGRFWQVDPLADINPQESWNPYQYAYNNPIKYSDPYGDCPTCFTGAGIGILTETVAQVGAAMVLDGKGFMDALTGVDKSDIAVAGAVGFITGALDGGASKMAKFVANDRNRKMMTKVLKKGMDLIAETLENVAKDYGNGEDFNLASSLAGALAEVGMSSAMPSSRYVNRQLKNADVTINKMNKKLDKGKTLTNRQQRSLESAQNSKKTFTKLKQSGEVASGAISENTGNAAAYGTTKILDEVVVTPKGE